MQADFEDELTKKLIPEQVIQWLKDEHVHSRRQLANFVDHRKEIKTIILQGAGLPDDRQAKADLTEIWREANSAEDYSIERVSRGVQENIRTVTAASGGNSRVWVPKGQGRGGRSRRKRASRNGGPGDGDEPPRKNHCTRSAETAKADPRERPWLLLQV